MRFIISYATALLLTICFVSCTSDAYDKGEGKYSLMRGDLADLQVATDKQIVSFVTDEGDYYSVKDPFTLRWVNTADTIYRAYIYYIKEEQSVDVVGVGQVLVLRPRREVEPKTDATGLESIWLSSNKKYLNMSLLLKTGSNDDSELHQTLGATIDTLMVNDDGTKSIHLHLYHDQGGVPEFYTQRTYVSIPVADMPVDSVHLRVNTYEGWRERTIGIK